MVIVARGRVRDGKIELSQPVELPEGTEVAVSISPVGLAETASVQAGQTGQSQDLADLPFFGMWAGREDMADSVAWVRRQRQQWQHRLTRRD
ncbi:MAG: antitoxin family protein [Chloroflexi bacterium]|nr:antitoxin family protein [Chloroflexota bacterium]